MEEIVNRVAKSGIISLDLADFNHPGERIAYDIKENLFQGLILREKDFRTFLKEHDWSQYQGKNVAIHCSVDAIIPTWAYMLLATKLSPFANLVIFGSLEELEIELYRGAVASLDLETFRDRPVVIKGCGDIHIPTQTYIDITSKLMEVSKSVMYGEPCSTVPVFKKKKATQS